MSQSVKVIDVTRSYIPIDSKAFPETYHGTQGEDLPESRVPVVPYEGYNFLPTSQGYKSFFGISQNLNISDLTSRVDKIFIIQTQTYDNILVALCEDGIWTRSGELSGAWDHVVTLTIPAEGQHLDWTYCVIGKEIFCYRAQGASYYKFAASIDHADQPAASGTDISFLHQFPTTGAIPVGTYHYSLARRLTSTGALTLPSTGLNVVISGSAASVVLNIPTVAGTSLYRLYRTLSGVTYFRDVVPGLFEDYNEGWTLITLPDTSFQLYDPYTPTTVVPTFLNMSGQQGIFKAGIRLGFWDSENSISWSSIDDLGEYTPDVETLAGSAIFTDVTGRISNIIDLENGFVVYATRSIVYVAQAVSSTFQWNPQILSSTAGVVFLDQAIRGAEIGQHFAYTSSGLAKIQTSPGSQVAKLEFIVPEITDYLSKTTNPLYLKLLNNRYLCIETLDADYINAAISFTNENVEPIIYTFPGSSYIADIYPEETLEGIDFCTKAGILAGTGRTAEQQAQAVAAHEEAAGTPAPGSPVGTGSSSYPPNPSGVYEAEWDATLCIQEVPDAANITWIGSPCATVDLHGVERGMCPQAPVIKTDMYGLGSAGQQTLTGLKWNIKKLIQVQTAIWDWEDSQRSQYINAILGRAFEDQYHLTVNGYIPTGGASNKSVECLVGQFVDSNTWIDQGWAANKCSFWMTRTINRAMDIYRRRTDIDNGSSTTVRVWETAGYYTGGGSGFVNMPSLPPEDSTVEAVAHLIYDFWAAANPGLAASHPFSYSTTGTSPIHVYAPTTIGWAGYARAAIVANIDAYLFARNHGESVDITPIVDRAFCKIVGWRYTDAQGFERVVPGITDPECKAPDDPGFTAEGIISGPTPPISVSSGALCGYSFPDITIPGYSPSPLTWPPITVESESGTFLLQHGSIGPIYPTFQGAFVYDLELKKWGKLKAQYRQLLDYLPINTLSDRVISADDFRVQAGMLDTSGTIYVFDDTPDDSYIKWGKIGYYRKGFTNVQEIRVHFSTASTGSIDTETSIDGATAEELLSTSNSINSVIDCITYPNVNGRWHNVIVRGQYDIKYLEVRGFQAGRR